MRSTEPSQDKGGNLHEPSEWTEGVFFFPRKN